MNCKKCNKLIGHVDTKCTHEMCDVKEWCECCDNIMLKIKHKLCDSKNNHITYKRPYYQPYYKSKTIREICYYMDGNPYDVICENHYDKSHFIYCKCGVPLSQFVDSSPCSENFCQKDYTSLE